MRRKALSVREAGRKGGEKTARRGSEFYREIGKKGGRSRASELGSAGFKQLGQRGGKAVSQDHVHMVEIGRKGGQALKFELEDFTHQG